eukprot:7680484-Lingulodinium_polyedra.AAC.1
MHAYTGHRCKCLQLELMDAYTGHRCKCLRLVHSCCSWMQVSEVSTHGCKCLRLVLMDASASPCMQVLE